MTLTTRLSVFFMSMLAVVLLGFSAAAYLLTDKYLNQQSQERLNAALNTLDALAETEPQGVEWEPKGRRLNLEAPALVEPIVWIVSDPRGVVIDRSQVEGTDEFLAGISEYLQSFAIDPGHRTGKWLVGQRVIQAAPDDRATDSISIPKDRTDKDVFYSKLAITAGVSLDPVRTTLRQLAMMLLVLSLGIWSVALFLGQIVCRRALLPVIKMSKAASEIDASDLALRLPNVTSHDELEDLNGSFNRLLDRLQDTFERQRRFTGDASHQLRTPLTAILGQIEVALRRERSAEEYQQVLDVVQNQAGHLARLVESLLFLARADSESGIPSLEPLNLTTWLPEFLKMQTEQPRSKDMSFECRASNPCVIRSHPALLGELLKILIDNACKYSEPGTPIKIQLEQSGDAIWVKVDDQGCGIAKHDLDNLFVPFFRSDEARRRGIEGVGLGLSIARRLAKAFDANLSVTSHVGQGTSFVLWFSHSKPSDPLAG